MNSGDQEWAGLPMTERKAAVFSKTFELESTDLQHAIEASRDWLLERQSAEGYWVGELEGDTILESEYVLLLTWLGHNDTELIARCAKYIFNQQLPTGGWSLYPG